MSLETRKLLRRGLDVSTTLLWSKDCSGVLVSGGKYMLPLVVISSSDMFKAASKRRAC